MAVLEIAVEIGTSYTSIFLSGNGIVLREPTVIAFLGDPKQKRIRAVGQAAYEMLGKAPEKTTVVCPVVDGFIADKDSCILLLKEFVKRILPQNYIFFPKIKAILGVPTGLTMEERRVYEDVLLAANIKEITMVENIILSAVGIDLPISTSCGGLVVNVGGGITEIVAMSVSGVVSGCGVTIGGNLMDKALIDFAAGKHNLKLGLNTARKVKTEIGTLYENDTSEMIVRGIDLQTKNVSTAKIKAVDVCTVLRPYYIRIRDAIEKILKSLPPDIASDIYKTGIYFVGGGSKITGLEKFMSEELSLGAFVPEDPEYAAILGAGKLLSDKYLLSEILSQK